MLSLLLTITLAGYSFAGEGDLDPKIPDPIGFIARYGHTENKAENEVEMIEGEKGLEVLDKSSGPSRRVRPMDLVGECSEDDCSMFYVFGEEPGWVQLQEKRGVAAWWRRRAGNQYTNIESRYAKLNQQAQHGLKMANEIGGEPEEQEVKTIFHPLPTRLIYSHGFITKAPPEKMKVIIKAYPEAKGKGDSIEFDLLGSDFIQYEVTWGRDTSPVKSVFVREVDGDWLKIQFKPPPPFRGRAMWIKHDPALMSELRDFKGDRLEQAYIDAKVELPNRMETPHLLFTGSKRVNGKLWFEVELWSHKAPALDGKKADNDSENPLMWEPKLLRKGWVPYRDKDGRVSIDIYEGC